MKKTWNLYPQAPTEFFGTPGIPNVISQILYNRNIRTQKEIAFVLSGHVPRLHDPQDLPDMGKAIARLCKAIDAGETIGVFGDFDVDGVAATALLVSGLEKLGAEVAPYIPHRIAEGHGINEEAVHTLKRFGVSTLVTVDCGISSHREVALAMDLGMDVIITDHHVPQTILPSALATIDPKISNSDYPFEELTGAGLALKLVQGLYQQLGKKLPGHLFALAALGTVADLAPLQGENRSIVKIGIEELKITQNVGLNALYRRARLRPSDINSESIAFVLAPRLNASGRIQHAISSYRLLASQSSENAETLAEDIEKFNSERKSASEAAFETSLSKINTNDPILIVNDESFYPGISGLVASRLVEQFHKPALVMALEDNIVRASGRSIPEFNLISALSDCQDLFTRFGGHPMAAGFVMDQGHLSALSDRLHMIAGQSLKGIDLQPSLNIDAEIAPSDLMGKAYENIAALEPFGMGNPNPIFLAKGMKILHATTMGNNKQHLRLKLSDRKSTWTALAFRQGLGAVPQTNILDIVYTLASGSWRGERVVNLKVLDYRSA